MTNAELQKELRSAGDGLPIMVQVGGVLVPVTGLILHPENPRALALVVETPDVDVPGLVPPDVPLAPSDLPKTAEKPRADRPHRTRR